jgi:hypothetical protein
MSIPEKWRKWLRYWLKTDRSGFMEHLRSLDESAAWNEKMAADCKQANCPYWERRHLRYAAEEKEEACYMRKLI